jgi:hypothetical protein
VIDEDFIQSLVAELLGCTVIWSKGNGPKPRKPFATLRLYGYRRNGLDEGRSTNTAGVVEVRGDREATLEVQYFGEDAQQKLLELEQQFQRPTIVEQCFVEGVAFFDVQNIQDLTGLLDATTYEERASIDFSVRFAISTTDETGYIDKVTINADGTEFTVEGDENG